MALLKSRLDLPSVIPEHKLEALKPKQHLEIYRRRSKDKLRGESRKMSVAQSQTSLESLQCHFTWNLKCERFYLFDCRDIIEDIGTEEGNRWLGHIYNLQGFIQYKLGFTEDAKSFFTKAAEAFKLIREEDEGPWLVVNYGNLAWLYHDLGQAEESQTYLSKVDALMKKYPSPSKDELHPEIYAEKGWTMMYLSKDKEEVVNLFEKAISMRPEMVEWNTSFVLALAKSRDQSDTEVQAYLLEKMIHAKEKDPENLYLAAIYLLLLGKSKGAQDDETIKNEAQILRGRVLRNPVSSYSGIRPLLKVYMDFICTDEAIDLAEEALREHPDSRYLKRCVALCYKWKIWDLKNQSPEPGMMERAISLHEELISLYPHSSLLKKIDLAFIYSKSSHRKENAEQIYQELLECDLEPEQRQKVCHYYAKYLYFERNDRHGSIQQDMNAAAIPVKSVARDNSIRNLEKARYRGIMCGEIREFLENLQEPVFVSAAGNEISLESLQCHFTWNLNRPRSTLSALMGKLDDIHTEGNRWLGHIYNLQGFIQYKLGFTEDAKSFFTKAAEAFKLIREEDEGPWLVVNYGNLAWLHHDLGQAEESQTYLSKVDALMKKYPPPSMDELHPEIYAEKGWTMMYLSKDKEEVVSLFEKAISMRPEMVEWNTSFVLALANARDQSDTEVQAYLLEKMIHAKEKDPENLFLAAIYLLLLGKSKGAKVKETIKNEAQILRGRVLRNPVSSYSGIWPLLKVYKDFICTYEAIDLAEEALREHPDSRYLKRCVALCYKWKIWDLKNQSPEPGMFERAISLHEELISLYPHSSFKKKLDLAFMCAKTSHMKENAEQIYQELLESDLQPEQRQMVYNYYAKYLYFERNDRHGSIQQHMNAAAIPVKSSLREHSIRNLEKARDKGVMCGEIKEFLENLQEPVFFSAAWNEISLESLQCHFTWDLKRPRSTLSALMGKLDDVHTEGNRWLGHIYNLQGFIQYKLGFTEDAKSFFTKAAEAFKLIREEDEGPWLVVNYGNLAWLHHDLGQAEESQTYLSKVDALMKKYPPPSKDELHPEIYAEKGWAMMYLSKDKEEVVSLFEKAISMRPEMVEWNTSFVLGLANGRDQSDTEVQAYLLEKMIHAKEKDAENLFLAAVFLLLLGKNNGAQVQETIKNEAQILRGRVSKPVSSYSGIWPLLQVYRSYICIDEALDLAEEALRELPHSCYLKRLVALCYKWKILYFNQSRPRPGMFERAISLHEELISLYPHSSFKKKLDLAFINAKSSHRKENAEKIYQELLECDLEPEQRQMVYHYYANYLFFDRNDRYGSIQQHMNAAKIPVKSNLREHSIRHLEKARERGIMCREIEEFLENLQEPLS